MSMMAWLMWGLVFGSIGMGYFMYGKKQGRPVPLVCGIGLMVYPYFTGSSVVAMIAIGVVLMAVPWLMRGR